MSIIKANAEAIKVTTKLVTASLTGVLFFFEAVSHNPFFSVIAIQVIPPNNKGVLSATINL